MFCEQKWKFSSRPFRQQLRTLCYNGLKEKKKIKKEKGRATGKGHGFLHVDQKYWRENERENNPVDVEDKTRCFEDF